jgi:hypothetical protein
MKSEETDPWMYAAVGAVLFGVVWWLFRKTPAPPARATITREVPSVTPPAELPTVGAIASRFDEVQELYKMGYLTPAKAISQVEALEAEVAVLLINGVGEKHSAEALVARTQAFITEVRRYQALMTPPEA